VIIEYKRAVNENVINQGLFYLDWLMDHKGDFEILAMKKLNNPSIEIDWSSPRLLCIAGDFTRYDIYAVNQIARNIELLRYRRFGSDPLLLELTHSAKQARQSIEVTSREVKRTVGTGANSDTALGQGIIYRLGRSDPVLIDIYEAVKAFLQGLGEDVQVKELLHYVAFKKIKNFACLDIYPQARLVFVYLKINLKSVQLEDGFTRDMTRVGHQGTGDLQVTLRTMSDFEKAKPLLERCYQES
jgi:predicted transport protein